MHIDTAQVDAIIQRHGRRREHLIAMLLEFQEEFTHLPEPVLRRVSEQVDVPLPSVLGIATFFRAFSLKPVGRYPVHVCTGTACHVKGAPRLLEAFERELKILRGQTTDDLLFSVNTVNCVGCCGLAPAILVGKDVHGKLKQADVPRIVKKYRPKEA